MSELKHRIEQLETEDPGLITLELEDGTTRSFPGLRPLQFLLQAEEELRRGSGPAADAVLRSVAASPNLGRMHELMRAVWGPIVESSSGKS